MASSSSSSSSRSSGPKFALDGYDFIRNMICESGFLGIMGYATYFGLLESSDMKEEDVIKAVRSHWLEYDVKPSRGILDELFSLEVDGTVAQNIDTKDKIIPLARDPNTEGPVTRSQVKREPSTTTYRRSSRVAHAPAGTASSGTKTSGRGKSSRPSSGPSPRPAKRGKTSRR
ncbi:hypothetical protein FOZ62_027654 [Perkinsus olseni]|uniref:Uncharacterized protein n=1 Tax=Perkinsus olseni TaxID=32597 RepID=A0A7J6TZX7_PEROL|nr:hypothetical protein FOZ62_027654 [Perkinsus olseni]